MLTFAAPAAAQTAPDAPTRSVPADTPTATQLSPSNSRSAAPFAELRGRTVEDIRIEGNTQVSDALVRNVIRTRVGEPFDPETVIEDYQRIFQELRSFSNVEAFVEQTKTGGIVVIFQLTEQRQVRNIRYVGNTEVETAAVRQVVDLKVGQSIDAFRISMARRAIEEFYRDRNFPFAHVTVDQDLLTKEGIVVFNIIEGPNVRVRRVNFVGNKSISDDRLSGIAQTKYWVFIFRPGTFDPDTIDDDVGRIRNYYQDKGFFDVRVGRKLIWSPDNSELQVDFVIDEGVRYKVGKVSFKGNESVSEAELRARMKLLEGEPFDKIARQRDIREIVHAYSPFGFIYEPPGPRSNPDYLHVQAKELFSRDPGTVDLVYEISEGKPFRLGRILVKGNSRTQDKVVLREMRVSPGQMYDSGALQDATERLRATPYFTGVTMTPIGDDPDTRDLLVEVTEAQTAEFRIGAGVNSNGGVGADITYEQRNFDITDWPQRWGDVLSDRAFIGAGQTFRMSLQPGTENTNASVRFFEPYVFDMPYSFSAEAYYRDRDRRDFDETRAGGRLALGKRFNYVYSAQLALRGEDVEIHDIEDPPLRAPEILEAEGHQTITSVALSVRRDTTNRGMVPARGTSSQLTWESFGALGGEFQFQKITASFNGYHTLAEDLLERKTILGVHLDAGYIYNDAPFFERFYAGGIGSVRGFRFRGISPRSGLADDPVGGDFSLTGSVELGFPLAGDTLRGVVFADAGTVEEEFEINTVRTSIGAGFRLIVPMLGPAPIAIDFAFPLNRDDDDDTQVISFSFGIAP
ncbi:MAG TPA: BamA/TamA family outer membrane protein [Tepidisphaeraceae bacterium]|nr:BamA/TamA family outer membrane protein [Tepidisphaeraceae bacterium]